MSQEATEQTPPRFDFSDEGLQRRIDAAAEAAGAGLQQEPGEDDGRQAGIQHPESGEQGGLDGDDGDDGQREGDASPEQPGEGDAGEAGDGEHGTGESGGPAGEAERQEVDEEDPEIPEQYRGKSPRELVKILQDSQSHIGKTSTELAELRGMVNAMLAERQQPAPQQQEPEYIPRQNLEYLALQDPVRVWAWTAQNQPEDMAAVLSSIEYGAGDPDNPESEYVQGDPVLAKDLELRFIQMQHEKAVKASEEKYTPILEDRKMTEQQAVTASATIAFMKDHPDFDLFKEEIVAEMDRKGEEMRQQKREIDTSEHGIRDFIEMAYNKVKANNPGKIKAIEDGIQKKDADAKRGASTETGTPNQAPPPEEKTYGDAVRDGVFGRTEEEQERRARLARYGL